MGLDCCFVGCEGGETSTHEIWSLDKNVTKTS